MGLINILEKTTNFFPSLLLNMSDKVYEKTDIDPLMFPFAPVAFYITGLGAQAVAVGYGAYKLTDSPVGAIIITAAAVITPPVMQIINCIRNME